MLFSFRKRHKTMELHSNSGIKKQMMQYLTILRSAETSNFRSFQQEEQLSQNRP